jgi:hypothetical protein
MRIGTAGLIGLLALACSKPADQPVDQATVESPAVAEEAAPAPSLAAFAGNWDVKATVKEGKGKPVGYTLTASDTRDGWTVTFPGREPVPMRVVAVEGDSVVTEGGPFESGIRKGVQVNTRSVTRIVDGKAVGTTRARYDVDGPDTVTVLGFEGTRMP